MQMIIRYFAAALVGVLAFTASLDAQNRNRKENPAMLGVVTAPAKSGVEVLYVLKKSPAAKGKIKAGDIITAIADAQIKTRWDLDDALAKLKPKQKVNVELLRDKKALKVKAKLSERSKFKGEFLKKRARGETGFKAPRFLTHSWIQTDKKRPQPSKDSTKGKVVVFHTFQSW